MAYFEIPSIAQLDYTQADSPNLEVIWSEQGTSTLPPPLLFGLGERRSTGLVQPPRNWLGPF